MIDRKVNRLPVVDAGQLVGIVTRADLDYVTTTGTVRTDISRRLNAIASATPRSSANFVTMCGCWFQVVERLIAEALR